MYERLIALLIQEGRHDEALSWGKLYFGETAYQNDATQKAMQSVTSVWASQGEIAKIRAFAAAQGMAADGTRPRQSTGRCFDAEFRGERLSRAKVVGTEWAAMEEP